LKRKNYPFSSRQSSLEKEESFERKEGNGNAACVTDTSCNREREARQARGAGERGESSSGAPPPHGIFAVSL